MRRRFSSKPLLLDFWLAFAAVFGVAFLVLLLLGGGFAERGPGHLQNETPKSAKIEPRKPPKQQKSKGKPPKVGS